MKAWPARYVGIPYAGPNGKDCYALVRLVLSEQCGIHVPDPKRDQLIEPRTSPETADSIIADVGWIKVDGPLQPFDVVLFEGNQYQHCGIMIDGRSFLHTQVDTGAVIARITAEPWKRYLKGVYRIQK